MTWTVSRFINDSHLKDEKQWRLVAKSDDEAWVDLSPGVYRVRILQGTTVEESIVEIFEPGRMRFPWNYTNDSGNGTHNQ
jgi:hypothetical protein